MGLFDMFKKKSNGGASDEKLSRPKEILEPVGRYLVVNLKKDPDWVWNLECVTRSSSEMGKRLDFRVFDPRKSAAKGLSVKNYHTLDANPDLILYHGWVDMATRKLEVIEDKGAPERAA